MQSCAPRGVEVASETLLKITAESLESLASVRAILVSSKRLVIAKDPTILLVVVSILVGDDDNAKFIFGFVQQRLFLSCFEMQGKL